MSDRVPLKNNKKCIKRNWCQSKNGFDLFENNENDANVKKINRIILDTEYNSNDI